MMTGHRRPRVLVLASLFVLTFGSAFVVRGAALAIQTSNRTKDTNRDSASEKRERPGRDGFIQRWLILEPQRIAGQLTEGAVRAVVGTDDFRTQLATFPREGDTAKSDTATSDDTPRTWHAVDASEYNVNLYHFAYGLKKPTSNVVFLVATVLRAPRPMRDVRLAIGSNAASVWWVNGREVIGIYNDRQTVIDDGVSKRLMLNPGTNVIRGAVFNAGGATDFCARFLDSEDRPISDFTVSLTQR